MLHLFWALVMHVFTGRMTSELPKYQQLQITQQRGYDMLCVENLMSKLLITITIT